MGGSQSRKDDVLLDRDGNVITLTDDAARRMYGLPEKGHPSGDGRETPQLSNEQMEKVMQQLENDYRQRLIATTAHNQRIRAQEFAKAVQEVEAKFLKESGGPVCQDLQQKVYECYQHNLNQPLKCSSVVRSFTEAVEKARSNAVFAKQS